MATVTVTIHASKCQQMNPTIQQIKQTRGE
jgi:hypothetical protein